MESKDRKALRWNHHYLDVPTEVNVVVQCEKNGIGISCKQPDDSSILELKNTLHTHRKIPSDTSFYLQLDAKTVESPKKFSSLFEGEKKQTLHVGKLDKQLRSANIETITMRYCMLRCNN